MTKVAIAIHGGAGKEGPFTRAHRPESEEAIRESLMKGYELLKKGKSALTAVEYAVVVLEDSPYFNAGRGSVLNELGEVEMDAAIMDGKTIRAGAVSMVRNVKNPIILARNIMFKTSHVLLSGYGALRLAKDLDIELQNEDYFITPHQYESYLKKYNRPPAIAAVKSHGTVGAVARDKNGNLAAATSTGGTSYSLPGRIGDSCIIGAGCYANNKTCAVSGTGHGETLILNSVAHTISVLMEYKKFSLQKACDTVIHKYRKHKHQEMGVVAIDKKGNITFSYNTQAMRRGYIDTNGKIYIAVRD